MYIDISEFHAKPPHIISLYKIKFLILIGLTLTKKLSYGFFVTSFFANLIEEEQLLVDAVWILFDLCLMNDK